MFFLQTLRLYQFKNYHEAKMEFCPQVNCFYGKNGAGKTNILDAIYLLSFTKSNFTHADHTLVLHEAKDCSVIGHYQINHTEEKTILSLVNGKKSLKVNEEEIKRFSAHIGHYPAVIITPNDLLLLLDGSEERRKFMDGIIAQHNKTFLSHLLMYNKLIEQRNKQLKHFALNNYYDDDLLKTLDELLVKHGTEIYLNRVAFLKEFATMFNPIYNTIAGANELADVSLESKLLDAPFATLLKEANRTDLLLQRTTIGPHKDDLAFTLNGYSLKKYGSQGQQKSFIIALKLAQYQYLKSKTNLKPLLLLDDIFEKLDEHRLNIVMQMIAREEFGQIFITDTHYQRLAEAFNKLPNLAVKFFNIEQGKITFE